MKSLSDRALSATTGRAVRQHLAGELGELLDLLDAEVVGLDLALDALDHPAPAAGLLLLVYTANSCAPCRRLTCHSNPPESSCQCGSEGWTIMDKRTRAQGSRYDLD